MSPARAKNLCALAFLGSTNALYQAGPVQDDRSDIGKSLYIVDYRRLFMKARLKREGRLLPGLSAMPLQFD